MDDEPDFAEMTAAFLEGEDDRFEVETAVSTSEGQKRLGSEAFDCIVCDYDMPGQNGIEFLEAVRADYPDLPFVLFTGKGSEEVASDAISAGVTDYLQKERGTSQYTLLANRVVNAVEQHRSRTALVESQKRLSLFIEQSPLGVIEYDKDFVIVRLNPAGEEILGYTEDELRGETWERLVTENSYENVDSVTDALSEDRGGFHSIDENRRKDGTIITVEWHNRVVTDETGAVVAIFSQFQDITDRKRRERELEATRRRLEAILENTTTPMFMKDADGRYVFVNQGHRELFGHDDDDVVGRTDHELFPRAMADEVTENDRIVLEEKRPIEIEESIDVGGEQRTFLSTKVPIYDTGERADPDEPVAIFGVAVDITERERYERELEQKNKQLDEFASVVSHDLRNPLNVVEGRLHLAMDECDSDHLVAATGALERCQALIDDLLTLARDGEQVRDSEAVDLAAAVGDCQQSVAMGETALVVEATRSVRADRSRLRQLLENLLKNAVDHGGSTVTVGDLPGGFYVADDGPGIPPTDRDRVFDPGYSTDTSGTGFGLAIVSRIVDAHGWEIAVSESESGGARFEITGVESD
nr:PAS domain S-box protein [Halogeometricum limi]